MIEGVIFDMDGLMFDTESILYIGMKEEGKKRNLDLPDSVLDQLIGCDSHVVEQFEEQYPGITDCMKSFQKNRLDVFFKQFPEPGSGNKKGLKELVQYLEQKDIPYAIASSSYVSDIQRLVDHAGFPMHPKEIVSSKEKGIPSKPDPMIFLETANRLGLKPENCLVLEDSKNGIMAARRAGMYSIYVPDKILPDKMMYLYIRVRCEDLTGAIDFIEEMNQGG